MKNLKLLFAPGLALLVILQASPAAALNVGFDAFVTASASDNINDSNRGSEIDGSQLRGQISVFGDHSSQRLEAGFTGEIGTRKQFDDEDSDDDIVTLTRFYGSLEVGLSKRSLSWYFGDVLGGSEREDGTQPTDDDELLENRRNIFITGPILSLDLSSSKTLDASLFYVNNSDDTDAELASLYTFQSSYTSILSGGVRWGVRLGDIYVDNPEENAESDYNRAALDFFLERTRGLDVLSASLGGTRYQADDFAVNGLSAQFRWDRTLTAAGSLYVSLNRDLVDETLTAIDSLSTTGDAQLPETAGIFNNTTLTFGYNYATTPGSFGWFAGVGDSAYEAVVAGEGFTEQASDLQDQFRYFTGFTATRALTNRLGARVNASFRREEFRNTEDYSESLTAGAELVYAMGRSFELLFGLQHDINDAQSDTGGAVGITDSVENRARITLTYEPPSRADRNLLVRLKSLVY